VTVRDRFAKARARVSTRTRVHHCCYGIRTIGPRSYRVRQSVAGIVRTVRGGSVPKTLAETARDKLYAGTLPREDLCLPLILPFGLMPPAAGIRDAVHRRAAPSPLCPDSAAAQSEAWVRLSPAINVSASRCSSRRTSTRSREDAVADHDDVVQVFTSNRANHPLGTRVLPRRARRYDHLPDVQRFSLM